MQSVWLEWRVFNRLGRSAHSMTRVTVPDHQIGQPTFAINIVVRPSPEVMQALVALQDRIEALAPEGTFHRVPAPTLHLSIYQPVWARTHHAAIVPQEWAGLEAETLMALQTLASQYEPFVLHQGEVQVGEKAIYLQFSPSAAMDRLRDEIEHYACDRFAGRHRPQIQHITLFRYHQAVPLQVLVGMAVIIAASMVGRHFLGAGPVREPAAEHPASTGDCTRTAGQGGGEE